MTGTCFISTFFENVGDELILEGSRHLLGQMGYSTDTFIAVSKNNPLSIYSGRIRPVSHGPLHRATALRRNIAKDVVDTLARTPFGRKLDRMLHADLVCIAGTPLFYSLPPHSFLDTPTWGWPYALFRDRLEPSTGVPLIALGVGSILDIAPARWLEERRRSEEAGFITRFIARSSAITTRDDATHRLLTGLAPWHEHKILRSTCPSLWAPLGLGISRKRARPSGPRRVSVSFSTESAAWSQSKADSTVRRYASLRLVADWLHAEGCELVLISHNSLDVEVSRRLAGEMNLAHVKAESARDLLEALAGVDLAVSWRVHGAVGAEALGVPSILFHTDSRSALAEDIGATVIYDAGCSDAEVLKKFKAAFRQSVVDDSQRLVRIQARRAMELDRLRAFLHEALSLEVPA